MDIIISNSAGTPIYEQICSQIKGKIISGELKEGDALPSMRLLAKELRISVITTKRAYEELERDGFLVTYPGKGSFVAGKNLDLADRGSAGQGAGSGQFLRSEQRRADRDAPPDL